MLREKNNDDLEKKEGILLNFKFHRSWGVVLFMFHISPLSKLLHDFNAFTPWHNTIHLFNAPLLPIITLKTIDTYLSLFPGGLCLCIYMFGMAGFMFYSYLLLIIVFYSLEMA